MPSDIPPPNELLAVFVGGAIGSTARYMAGYLFQGWLGSQFPWATLCVNVAGSFGLGWFGTLALARPTAVDPLLRLFLTTGFAGGFTTFSAFTFETFGLFQRGETALGWANIAANLVVGFGFALLGIWIARYQGAL